jgi:hypothetical protein
MIAIYSENHTKPMNAFCGQNTYFEVLKQVLHIVPTTYFFNNVMNINIGRHIRGLAIKFSDCCEKRNKIYK